MKDISLYIHIPFCSSKCFYCDFTSFSNKNHLIDKYIDNVIVELSLYKKSLENYRIKTIFIGGGTPSVIDEGYIVRLMDYIYKNFSLRSKLETTIEVNPGTLTLDKSKAYMGSGINRVSIGAQSLRDKQLKTIGRNHKVEDFYNTYSKLRTVGFKNISVDLIFGLPEEELSDVLFNIDTIANLGVEHISYYGLIIEPGTPMDKLYNQTNLNLPSEDAEREMYHKIIKKLTEKGYGHYEISNFAQEGFQSEHNKAYWKIEPYVGIGLNSHSFFGKERYWNYSNFQDYFKNLEVGSLPIEERQKLEEKDEIADYCIFGIRLIRGIDKTSFKNRFGATIESLYGDVISKHIKNDLLESEGDFIRLTKKGLDLANHVEVDFLL